MKLEIIKDDPSGLKKGQKVDVNHYIGGKLIENGIAKEIKKKVKKEDK